jgi:hypothetical protein
MEQPVDAMLALEARLLKLEGEIERIEEDIAEVVSQLKPLEKKSLKERDQEEKDEIARLSKKEEQLRKEKEQLRKEKEQLREKEKLLLLRANAEDKDADLPAVSAPSLAKPSIIDKKCQSASVLSLKIYLDVVQVLTAGLEDEQGGIGTALMDVLRMCDRTSLEGGPVIPPVKAGIFLEDKGAKKAECLYSGALCSTLAAVRRVVGEKDARWLHRVPERTGGEMDIQLCVISSPKVWLPVMVIEVGLRQGKDSKHAQASAYAINVSSQMGAKNVLLLAEVVIDTTSGEFAWLTVTGCHVVAADRLLARVLLWTGPLTAASWDNLLRGCDMVAKWNTWQGERPIWKCVNANVAVSDSVVYKAFDYRGRMVVEDARRRADLSLDLIQHCERVVVCKDLVVISYPRLEGSHKPTTVGHFLCLLESLARLHKRGIVHGDIRASNIIFDANGGATLIDFDFSGGEHCRYPPGFNTKIGDGKRARGARSGSNLSFEHDWEALAGLMEMAHPVDQTLWKNATSAVESGNIQGAVKLLDGKDDVSLEFRVGTEESKGTGSPPRNQGEVSGKKGSESQDL